MGIAPSFRAIDPLRPSAVMVLIRLTNKTPEICLVRRSRTNPAISKNYMYEKMDVFPGGRAVEGETPLATAIRETFEEMGIQITTSDVLGCIYRGPDEKQKYCMHAFLAIPKSFKFTLDKIELKSYSWVNLSKIAQLITNYGTRDFHVPSTTKKILEIVYNLWLDLERNHK